MTERKIIEVMADAIVRTWDFCGNAREAAKLVCNDYEVEWSEELFLEAMEQAHNCWEEIKKEMATKER